MEDPRVTRWTFEAIGTIWHIDLPELEDDFRERVVERVTNRIEEFDKNYSRFRDDSLVSEMARRASTYTLPEDAQPLMDLYVHLYQETAGKFTPLIGQVLVDAGYDAHYSLQPKELTSPPTFDDVVNYHFPTLELRQPALFDFGAAGKGYLVDLVAGILEEMLPSSSSYTINAGGDIRVRVSSEDEPSRIGLENPDDVSQVIGVATLTNGSICGSAGNRRAWKGFHHIIDPHALVSPRNLKAVWVSAATALVADAMTTCLYLVDVESFVSHVRSTYPFEYFIVYADNSFKKSPDFPAEIFLETAVV